MTTEKMNIHKALSEVKVLDSKINNAMEELCVVVSNKNSNNKINGILVEDYKKVMTGSYDKVVSLIARRTAIKQAIAISNSVTKVEINGVEYTVAEAIELKNHGMEYKKDLLAAMKKQYNKALLEISKVETTLEDKANELVISLYGASDKQISNEKVLEMKKEYIEQNRVGIVDPINVRVKIEELEDEIEEFMSEVDSTLSTSNSLTVIEVNYE